MPFNPHASWCSYSAENRACPKWKDYAAKVQYCGVLLSGEFLAFVVPDKYRQRVHGIIMRPRWCNVIELLQITSIIGYCHAVSRPGRVPIFGGTREAFRSLCYSTPVGQGWFRKCGALILEVFLLRRLRIPVTYISVYGRRAASAWRFKPDERDHTMHYRTSVVPLSKFLSLRVYK